MNFGPEIVVLVSPSSVPVKFRAEDSPTWGTVLQQLNIEHGPGVLKDGHGYNKLLNAASTDQAVPLGTYEYITQSATGDQRLQQHKLVIFKVAGRRFCDQAETEHGHSIVQLSCLDEC